MIIDKFSEILEQLVTRSAPNTRDQSASVIDNAETAIMRLAGISDNLNSDKAGIREGYKLQHRYNVPATATVFVYADRPDIVVDVEDLTTAFMNTKAFDDRYYIDGLVEVLAGTKCTRVSDNAFQNCTTIKKADLPSVTYIGNAAFSGCANLVDVNLPMVTDLQTYAFRNCTGLKEVSLPAVTNAGAPYPFGGCTALETVHVPAVVSVGQHFFDQCANLKVVDFGSSLTSVPTTVGIAGAFAIATLIVPDGLLTQWKESTSWSSVADHIVSQTESKYVRRKDLETYQKKSEMSDYVKTTDLAPYAKASEYTKTTVLESTYAKKTDLDSYDKKTDIIEGGRVNIGKKTFTFSDANDQIMACQQITFTTESLGMADGDKLTSFTIRTRSDNVGSKSVCIKFGKGELLIGVTDILTVNQPSHDYKFILVNPITLRAGETYVAQFSTTQQSTHSPASLGIRLRNIGSGNKSDIYVDDKLNWRPYISVEYIATATVTSLSNLINGLIDTRSNELTTKLEPLRTLNPIGSGDYSYDDVKDRVDTILTVLKSFL